VPLKKPFIGSKIVLDLQALTLQNTEPMNLVGNPALALPIPLKGRSVPVTSLQIVGPNFSEADLLNVGHLTTGSLSIHCSAEAITATMRNALPSRESPRVTPVVAS